MENPTNADLAKQIEQLATSVDAKIDRLANSVDAKIDKLAEAVAAGFAETHQKMATKEEMNKRFDSVEQRLDRIEKSHGYRLETLEHDVADLKT
jgi:flagellar biosynthesis/type III secretory pathway protein FliH